MHPLLLSKGRHRPLLSRCRDRFGIDCAMFPLVMASSGLIAAVELDLPEETRTTILETMRSAATWGLGNGV